MSITIYHNPACGTSRNTLALIRNSGAEPLIVDYLTQPPSQSELKTLIAAAGLTVRQAMREKGTPYDASGLADPSLTEEQLLAAMLAHPILINRPFVVTEKGTRLCRPAQQVLDILPQPQRGPFSKEDGEIVIDQHGQRVAP